MNHKLWNITVTERYILNVQVLLETVATYKLKVHFETNPYFLISMCRSMYEVDLALSVVSFILSSME